MQDMLRKVGIDNSEDSKEEKGGREERWGKKERGKRRQKFNDWKNVT